MADLRKPGNPDFVRGDKDGAAGRHHALVRRIYQLVYRSGQVEQRGCRHLSKPAIKSAALAATTRSAASGSFRCWTETTTPQVGDLVVFREPGSTQRCSGKGHVAFYAGEADRGYIRILGGNQLMRGTSGAVTVSRYPRDGGEGGRLRFLGYRTAAGLR